MSWWIILIIGFAVGTWFGIGLASVFAAKNVTWWRGRAEHLEKLICVLAKQFPCKLWDALPPYVQDDSMRIVEKYFRKEL